MKRRTTNANRADVRREWRLIKTSVWSRLLPGAAGNFMTAREESNCWQRGDEGGTAVLRSQRCNVLDDAKT